MLVTGATGFLGRHVVQASEADSWELISLSSKLLDITNRARTLETIAGWKPTAVVHLAYRKDRRTIVDGSTNVANAAASCGARLVHLSTDVVFAGRPDPYVESDPVDATIDYGWWKAEAERAVTTAHPTALIVRTSLLYGTDEPGHCQVDVERIGRGGQSGTYFTDEVRCPVHVDDVAVAVSRLAARPEVTGPLHVAGPEPISRAEFARLNARRLGFDPKLIHTGSLASSPQKRPGVVLLDSTLATSMGFALRGVTETLG